MDEHGGPVIGVIGGSGGVGASSLAAVLALTAAPAVLVDLDPAAGGVDVLLGLDAAPGARWSGLHLAGGRLDADDLVAGLPAVAGTAVLAADGDELDPAAVRQVVAAAATRGPVVLDLPRTPGPAADAGLDAADLAVVVARADVGGLVAAHAVVAALAGRRPGLTTGVVVRRGHVPPGEAAVLVGAPLLGSLPPLGARADLDPHRPPRPEHDVARGLLAGVRTRPLTLLRPPTPVAVGTPGPRHVERRSA